MGEIVILGGGESGTGAALLAQAKGFKVFVSDLGTINKEYEKVLSKAQIPFEQNGHTKERILKAQEVIKSPGIPDTVPLIKQLDEQGTSVIDEIEFAARYTQGKIVGITGSNGKNHYGTTHLSNAATRRVKCGTCRKYWAKYGCAVGRW